MNHWSSTTIPSIWHLSVGGLRVGPISSTEAYEAMSLLLLILRALDKKIIEKTVLPRKPSTRVLY